MLPPGLRPKQPKLPPRQRARAVVQSLQDAVIACLREQQHIISLDRRQRYEMLGRLADSFIEGSWHPENAEREDIDAIPAWLLRSIVFNTANGIGLAGYEAAIYEQYQRLDAPEQSTPIQEVTSMPQVQNPWRSGLGAYRRAYPRGKLPQR